MSGLERERGLEPATAYLEDMSLQVLLFPHNGCFRSSIPLRPRVFESFAGSWSDVEVCPNEVMVRRFLRRVPDRIERLPGTWVIRPAPFDSCVLQPGFQFR